MSESTLTGYPVPSEQRPGWRVGLARASALLSARTMVPLWLTTIVLLGALLRFSGLDWDHNIHHHPDERFLTDVVANIGWPTSIREYLNEATSPLNPRNVMQGDPPSSKFPFWVYGDLALTLVKGTTVALDKLAPLDAGSWQDYEHNFKVGRVLNGFADLGTLLFVFLIARRLYKDHRVALLAAFLYSVAVLPIQHAHFWVVDNLTTFFVTVTLFWLVRIFDTEGPGHLSDFLLAGLCFGLAMATKVSVATMAALFAAVGLVKLIQAWRSAGTVPQALVEGLILRLGLAAFMTLLAFRIFQPYAFAGPITPAPRWMANLKEVQGQISGEADPPWGYQWANRVRLLFPWKNMVLWGMGLPLGLAAWAAWGAAAWGLLRRQQWVHLVPVLWVLVLLLHQGNQWVMSMRYLLPIYPMLVLLAAWGLVRLWHAGAATRARGLLAWTRTKAGLLGAIVVGGTLLYALAFANIYRQPHTHLQAAQWLYDNVPTSAVVGLEHYDEGIPYGNGILSNPEGRAYRGVELQWYHGDNPEKLEQALTWLDEVEYIVPVSNRLYGSTARLPARYPMTGNYYQALFDGSLGFERVADITAGPQLFGIELDDQYSGNPQGWLGLPWDDWLGAEEAFTVYDHPRVQIFRKTPAYNREAARAILTEGVDFANISQLTAKQWTEREGSTEATATTLKFSPEDRSFYARSGTWARIFDRDGIANRLPLPMWVLLLQVLFLLGLPYARTVGRGLPERGYALARPLGLLLVAWLTWMLGSLHLMTFSVGSILLSMLVVGLGGLLLEVQNRRWGNADLRLHNREQEPENWGIVGSSGAPLWEPRAPGARIYALRSVASQQGARAYALRPAPAKFSHALVLGRGARVYSAELARPATVLPTPTPSATRTPISKLQPPSSNLFSDRRLWLLAESVFWLAFALVLLIRWANPDIWHQDLGGERPMDFTYLNGVIKSAYFPPMDPWFAGGYINYYYFGFVVAAVMVKLTGIIPAVAYNLLIPTFFALLAAGVWAAALALIVPLRRAMEAKEGGQRISGGALRWAAFAVLLVCILGNLGELEVLGQTLPQLSKLTFRSGLPGLETTVKAADGLVRGVILGGQPIPGRMEWPYWNATRISSAGINEFPWFTFLYADLHAHMMALPFTALAIALALAVLRAPLVKGRVAEGVRLFLVALVLGALWPMNTWDFPTYAIVAFAGLGLREWRRDGRITGRGILAVVWRWLLVVAVGRLLFHPFHAAYGSAYSSVERWRGDRTGLGDFLVMHGVFLFTLFFALVSDFALGRGHNGPVRVARFGLRNLGRSRRATRHYRALVHPGALQPGDLIVLPILGFGAVVLGSLLGWGVPALSLVLLLFALALFFRGRPQPLWQMALFLVILGLGLTAAVEVVVLKGDVGRMNTVFKFYLQVWVLWGLAAAAGAATIRQVWRRWLPEWRAVWSTGFVALCAVAALYPVFATYAKINDRFDRTVGPTLNGAAFLEKAVYRTSDPIRSVPVEFSLRWDAEAIRWMQDNVPGSPTVAEINTAPTVLYGWGNRYAMWTGNPAIVGWDHHQRQQRAATFSTEVDERVRDVRDGIYSTPDADAAHGMLTRYGAQYLVVGPLERAFATDEGIAKFEAARGRLWDLVYENEEVKIYRIIGAEAGQ